MSQGKIDGPVATVWVGPRTMRLLFDVTYIDSKGRKWIAPAGSLIDGSSIPRFFWRIIGSPFVGLHRYASIWHDIACEKREQWTDFKTAHWLYWDIQIAVGERWPTAFIRWLAVRLFGPRWKFPRGQHPVR